MSRNASINTARDDAVETFKANLAEWLESGHFRQAVRAIEATGVGAMEAEDAVFNAMTDLVENGWDDYL